MFSVISFLHHVSPSVYDAVVIAGGEGALWGRTSSSLTLAGLLSPLKCILGGSREFRSSTQQASGARGLQVLRGHQAAPRPGPSKRGRWGGAHRVV